MYYKGMALWFYVVFGTSIHLRIHELVIEKGPDSLRNPTQGVRRLYTSSFQSDRDFSPLISQT